MNRLILVEPSMGTRLGHERSHALPLAEECARRDLGFHVLTHEKASPETIASLPARRTFRFKIYSQLRRHNSASSLLALRRWSRRYKRDFTRAFRDLHAQPSDLMLLNTVNIAVLRGYASWLSAKAYNERPATVVALRLVAEQGLPGSLQGPILPQVSRWLYRRALDKLHKQLGPKLLLATDTRLIGEDYERLIGRDVAHIPLPIAVPQPVAPKLTSSPPHLVFPSGAGPERGFQLLPDALAGAASSNTSFTATIRAAGPLARAPLIDRLEAMAPQVRLILGELDEGAFFSMLSDADAVLLPYDPQVFAKRSSQIIAQSAALGRPVIVMAGSFLERECQLEGIVGVSAEAFTSKALAAAIQRFCADRKRLTAAAWAACPAQRRRHTAAGFMDQLTEFDRRARTQQSIGPVRATATSEAPTSAVPVVQTQFHDLANGP